MDPMSQVNRRVRLWRGAAVPTAAFDLLRGLQVHPHAAMAGSIAGTEVINLCY